MERESNKSGQFPDMQWTANLQQKSMIQQDNIFL